MTVTANKVIEFTCGTSGADINLSSLSITAGDTVSCSSLTITVPAS
jgi:dTDP-4-amino-4,6-dideoxygalactose transaminase